MNETGVRVVKAGPQRSFSTMSGAESTEFLVVGCGPAGATAAREAAGAGVETVVLERDAVVGAKRVCAAGLRPGFCNTFDLPREIVHCDTPRLALFDDRGGEHEIFMGPGHTTTREELDGTMARLAQADGAEMRTQRCCDASSETATGRWSNTPISRPASGARSRAQRLPGGGLDGAARLFRLWPLAWERWRDGLLTSCSIASIRNGRRRRSRIKRSRCTTTQAATGVRSSPGCFPNAITWRSVWADGKDDRRGAARRTRLVLRACSAAVSRHRRARGKSKATCSTAACRGPPLPTIA